MSLGFMFFLPLAMGFVAVYVTERRQPQTVAVWLQASGFTVLACIGGTVAMVWEGLICAVMFLPFGLAAGMIGGLAAGFLMRTFRTKPAANVSLACVMVLPLLVAPWERVLAREELRTVQSAIDVHASPETVWRNIERVPTIAPEELQPSWARRMGFPRPVEATLSFAGVGGVRHATFEGGVLFIETVDVWEPQHRLAFSIRPQTAAIPPTTFDEHVTVGGPFFDVLRGEYSLEPLPGGITRIHLSSRHRLSTDFNWYARLWTDAVMADIQNTILQVIHDRCEAAR